MRFYESNVSEIIIHIACRVVSSSWIP